MRLRRILKENKEIKIKEFGTIRCENKGCSSHANMFIKFNDGEKLNICHSCLTKFRDKYGVEE